MVLPDEEQRGELYPILTTNDETFTKNVCHLILSSLSEEAQMHLRSVGAFTKAVDDNDFLRYLP
jgi:hypothetical protein